MINSNIPAEKPLAQAEASLENSGETIIYHTEIPDQPDSAFKKFLLLFKRKPSASPEGTVEGEEKPAPAGPKRSLGQGLLRRGKSKS